MKKKMLTALFAAALCGMVLTAGCSRAADEKAQEYKELGISQMEKGDYESAAASFQKALDQSVGNVGAEEIDLCYYKALALAQSGDTEGACDEYTALIDLDEDNWEVYYLRGTLYLEMGESELAEADYETAAGLHKNDTELNVHIYEKLSDAGLQEDGQTYLTQVLETEPSDGEDYYYLGYAYYLSQDSQNAETNLKKADEEGYGEALLLLGKLYTEAGNADEAAKAFSDYYEANKEDADALKVLGETALETERYEDAVTYLNAALEEANSVKAPAIRKELIAAYEHAGDYKNAYKQAKAYLDQNEDEDVRKEYEFLKTRVTDNSGSSDASGETDGAQ